VQTGDYPTLARVFSDASLSAADAFESGLEYVLDGVSARVGQGVPAAGGRGAADAAAMEQPSMADNEASATSTVEDEAGATSAGSGKHGRFGRKRT
jgi:tetracycline repressor-like protein